MDNHPSADPRFDFCTSSIGRLVQPSVEEADPGNYFLIIEDGSVLIDFPLDQAPRLAHLILTAYGKATQEA